MATFQGGLVFEPGVAQPPGQGQGFPAGDLVLAQDLEEVQVAELRGAGLGERASRVSSMPDSLRARSDWASALRSVAVAAVVMVLPPRSR